MKELAKQKEINKLVFRGMLPIAFYNSKIEIFTHSITEKHQIEELLNTKYQQINIPRANSNKCISKPYDLF